MGKQNLTERLQNNLARNLRHLRILKGVTQSDIAKIIHVSRKHYRDIEQGKSIPDLETVCRLADYYGVNLLNLIELNIEDKYQEFCGKRLEPS